MKKAIFFFAATIVIPFHLCSQEIMETVIEITLSRSTGTYKHNIRSFINHGSITNEDIKGVPPDLETYQKYKVDFMPIHSAYLKQLKGDSIADRWKSRLLMIDTTFLTAQMYDHYMYAVCGFKNGNKIIIIDADNNKDLSNDKKFTFPYDKKKVRDRRTNPWEYTVDSISKLDRTAGNELFLNYQIYDGQEIKNYHRLVEVQPHFSTPNPTATPRAMALFDFQIILLTAEHARGRFEFLDTLYEIAATPSPGGYQGSMISIKNLDNPSIPIKSFSAGNKLFLSGYALTVDLSAEGNDARIHITEETPKTNIHDFAYNLEDIQTREKYNLDLSQSDYTILHFFGTWCGPCKGDFSKLTNFSSQKPHINLVGIATEQSIDFLKLNELKTDYALNWDIVVDQYLIGDKKHFAYQLNINRYPTYLILNRVGQIMRTTSKFEQVKNYFGAL